MLPDIIQRFLAHRHQKRLESRLRKHDILQHYQENRKIVPEDLNLSAIHGLFWEASLTLQHRVLTGEDLELGEPISDIYNDNCTLNVGYDKVLTAPIVHDIGQTDEPLEDHMTRLSEHYHGSDLAVGERFDAMAALTMKKLDRRDSTGAITETLSFRDEMLRTGETPV